MKCKDFEQPIIQEANFDKRISVRLKAGLRMDDNGSAKGTKLELNECGRNSRQAD